MELEGQLDYMEAEMEKMRMYEQSYHAQEQKLKATLDRIDHINQEKENLRTAHYDIVNEFSQLKKQNDEAVIECKSLKLEVAQLKG